MYLKALHVIFVVTWFAGLFYIVRLLVYQAEAQEQQSVDVQRILIPQYRLMAYRLWYIITWPSAVLTLVFALALLHLNPGLLYADYFQVKLGFVTLLYVYQFKLHSYVKQGQTGELKPSSSFFRLFNEVPTLVLIAVVFLIIVRDALNWMYGVAGIMGVAVLLTLGFKGYKKLREKRQNL